MRLTRTRHVLVSAGVILVLVAGAIGPSAAQAKAPAAVKHGGTVVLVTGEQAAFTQNFNPFNGNAASQGDLGFIYEPLVNYNLMQGGKAIPWLATSWAFSNGNKTLTFQLRQGVKWSDGKPFTSADVVFDANLSKNTPAADTSGMWPYLKNVTAKGKYTVVFNFKKVNTTMLYYIGNQMRIVQKAQWQGKEPITFTNPDPVGTGPFKLGSFSPQVYTFVRNPSYWQKGKPYIDAIRFPNYTSNESAQAAIIAGEVDWSNTFIPNAEQTLVAKGHGNQFWYAPVDHPVTLFLNLKRAPFNNVWVRRAISMVINRSQIHKVAETGYEPPSNAGFIQPQFESIWGEKTAIAMCPPKGDLAKAKAYMKKAGNVDLSKTFKIEVPTGWTDWDTAVSLIAADLSKIGIKAEPYLVTFPNPYLHDQQFGTFDMSYMWTNAGPSPYTIFHDAFYSKQSAPIGEQAISNYGRYSSKKMDSLIESFARTSDPAEQVKILKQMQTLAANDVPAVPVVTGALWYTYNNSRFTGWPSAKNPYTIGAPANFNNNLDVALHIHLK